MSRLVLDAGAFVALDRNGLLLAATGRDDVHDAARAPVCEPNDTLLTSDVDDLAALLAERRMSSVGLIRV